MGFQGSLDTVGLTDIFQLFGFGRKSGALHLRRGTEHGVIHFDEGDVFYATMNPSDAVGNLLVRADLVSADRWNQAVDEAGDDRTQGEVLAGTDGVDTGAIEAFLRERVEDTVFRLAQWDGGEFELVDEVHPFGPAFRFETEPLLATAERRMDEWRRISDVVPSVSMGVELVGDLPTGQAEVTLTRDQWRVVAALTPGCDIAGLASALGETEFRTCGTLAAMVGDGVIELVAAPVGRPATAEAEPVPGPAFLASPVEHPESGVDETPVLAEENPSPTGPGEWGAPAEAPSRMSLADLVAAAEETGPAVPHDGLFHPGIGAGEAPPASLAPPGADAEAEGGFVLGDLAVEYPPPTHEEPAEPAGEAAVAPFLDSVTPPPAVYSPSFDLGRQQVPLPPHAQPHYGDAGRMPLPDNGASTGEMAAAPAVGDYPGTPPGAAPFSGDPSAGTHPPAGLVADSLPGGAAGVESDPGGLPGAAAGDSELDKSLILRLIAGVKSL